MGVDGGRWSWPAIAGWTPQFVILCTAVEVGGQRRSSELNE